MCHNSDPRDHVHLYIPPNRTKLKTTNQFLSKHQDMRQMEISNALHSVKTVDHYNNLGIINTINNFCLVKFFKFILINLIFFKMLFYLTNEADKNITMIYMKLHREV